MPLTALLNGEKGTFFLRNPSNIKNESVIRMVNNKESFLYTLERLKTLEMGERVTKITKQWQTIDTHANELNNMIVEKEKPENERSSEFSLLARIVKFILWAIEKYGTTNHAASVILPSTDRELFRLLTADYFKKFITENRLEKQLTTLHKDILMLKELLGFTSTPVKAGKIARLFFKTMRVWDQIEESEKRQAREECLYQAYLKTL